MDDNQRFPQIAVNKKFLPTKYVLIVSYMVRTSYVLYLWLEIVVVVEVDLFNVPVHVDNPLFSVI